MQARGRAIRERGEKAIAELQAIEELADRQRSRDAGKRIEKLRETASKSSADSSRLFEEGGRIIREGLTLLKAGLKRYQDVPIVAEASGIYYTTDSDNMPRAARLLHHSLHLRFGPNAELNLADPPNCWLPFLQGLVRANEKKNGQSAKAFEAALKAEPRFQRARYELAVLLEREGKTDDAERVARQILDEVSDHAKARSLLSAFEPSKGNASEGDGPASPARSKKRKSRRRR
jgi:hypothetical protein